jgi:hypothetical protein
MNPPSVLKVSKLKKDLKRTKALLRDAQTMLEKTQSEGTNKVILRQLKNQVRIWVEKDLGVWWVKNGRFLQSIVRCRSKMFAFFIFLQLFVEHSDENLT